MSKETLETMARMTDSKIKVQDVVDKWLLLTYDLPHSEEGDKARALFLARAAAIGATRHTDSVYLLPWSPEAEALALSISKVEGGQVIAWAKAEPLMNKEEITQNYDNGLKPLLKEISVRLDKMDAYSFNNSQKRVIQMTPKTERLLDNAEAAIIRRGNDVLFMWLEILKTRFAQIARRA